jgi:hypothetical protein
VPFRKTILEQLSKPFPIWEYTVKRKILIIVLIEFFSISFKFIYKPFGGFNIPTDSIFLFHIGHIIINLAVLFFYFFVLPMLFYGYFKEKERTVFREFIWIVLLVILLTLCHAGFNELFNFHIIVANSLLDSLYINIGIGIFPIIIILLLAKLRQLKDNSLTDTSREATASLIEISSESGNDYMKISLESILYIKSSDNYSEVYFEEENTLKKKIFRISLTNLEKKIKSNFLFRIHRSYIINFLNIQSVVGNANKCEVLLKNTKIKIPVARSKRQEMLLKLRQLPVSFRI